MTLELINEAQLKLQTSLGPKYARYLENMRDWFGQRIDKEFFDEIMWSILTEKQQKLHESFMTLIASYCSPPPPVVKSDNVCSTPAYNNNNGVPVPENYENSPGLVEAPNSIGETDYITINFVESEDQETVTYTYGYEDEMEEAEPMEQVEEEVPADWLFKMDLMNLTVEDSGNVPLTPNGSADRFPSTFVSQFQKLRKPADISQDPDVLPNITHGYDIHDRLSKNPHLKKHFMLPSIENQSYRSSGSSIHGRFLLKAWGFGIDGVDLQASNLVVEAVKEHMKLIITAVIKQRRAFRSRHKRAFHSIGVTYPNPYLRQGHHLYDNPYASDTIKMAEVMQVPALLPTADQCQRMAALEVAASIPAKSCRFPANRVTLSDFLDVIENDPNIIPKNDSRQRLREIIGQNYKGYGGSDGYEDEAEENSQDLLPLCSY